MAFDKKHIPQLKQEILLVKTLADKVGYLVMLNMASAIFKVKDNNPKHPILKGYLTEIINDVKNHDEDYYKLVLETLNQNSETEKEETQIPTLDYWMLNIIAEALQREYNYRSTDRGLTKVLSKISEKEGFEKAKQVKAEIDSNKFDDVGQVACALKRIEEIKEAITIHATEK